MIRTGIGFDAHRLVPNRPLILGGERLDYHLGLLGHSDADVLAHALADALLGAVAAGDIGQHFSAHDARWKDANSLELLAMVRARLLEQGAKIVNVDAVVLAEAPPIAPHREAMRVNLAQALKIAKERVSVKASTMEGMGAVGRGEGIATMAVATVEMPDDLS